jgi:hypothetical protein
MTADQIYRFLQNPEKLNQETLPHFKALTEQYTAFETGWMLYLKNLKNLNDSAFENELIQGAIRIHDRRKLYQFLHGKITETGQSKIGTSNSGKEDDQEIFNLSFQSEYRLEPTETTEETMGEIARSMQHQPEKKQTLIEKFLEARPSMPPVKESESTSPLDSSNPPEQEDEDFVTETLALIYARQGYHKKAIQIFGKLSLKYPEKSTYFAGQIEKIKILMNN